MLPKLVFSVGVAAIAAALTAYSIRGSGYEHRDYDITVTKSGSSYSVTKEAYKLAYHGSTHWEIVNDTDDEVRFEMVEFQKDGGNDCPVDFRGNTGSTANCIGSVTIARRDPRPNSKLIKVQRGDAYTAQKYSFKLKINGEYVDPDIELERDPYGLIIVWISLGGMLSILVGWWLGRRK